MLSWSKIRLDEDLEIHSTFEVSALIVITQLLLPLLNQEFILDGTESSLRLIFFDCELLFRALSFGLSGIVLGAVSVLFKYYFCEAT